MEGRRDLWPNRWLQVADPCRSEKSHIEPLLKAQRRTLRMPIRSIFGCDELAEERQVLDPKPNFVTIEAKDRTPEKLHIAPRVAFSDHGDVVVIQPSIEIRVVRQRVRSRFHVDGDLPPGELDQFDLAPFEPHVVSSRLPYQSDERLDRLASDHNKEPQ